MLGVTAASLPPATGEVQFPRMSRRASTAFTWSRMLAMLKLSAARFSMLSARKPAMACFTSERWWTHTTACSSPSAVSTLSTMMLYSFRNPRKLWIGFSL